MGEVKRIWRLHNDVVVCSLGIIDRTSDFLITVLKSTLMITEQQREFS